MRHFWLVTREYYWQIARRRQRCCQTFHTMHRTVSHSKEWSGPKYQLVPRLRNTGLKSMISVKTSFVIDADWNASKFSGFPQSDFIRLYTSCTLNINSFLFLFIYFFNVYFWERERQTDRQGGAEWEGDTESEAGSRLSAVSTEPESGAPTHKTQDVTWAKVGRLANWATWFPF